MVEWGYLGFSTSDIDGQGRDTRLAGVASGTRGLGSFFAFRGKPHAVAYEQKIGIWSR